MASTPPLSPPPDEVEKDAPESPSPPPIDLETKTPEVTEASSLNKPEDTFPANTTLPADYSDVPSGNNSQDSSKARRKYVRGGRKKNQDLQSVSESHVPDAEDRSDLENGERRSPRGGRKPKLKHRDSGSKSPFDTGIRAFNLKRAEASGGRPFGVSVGDRKEKKGMKHKAKSTRGKRKQKEAEAKEKEKEKERENWESESESEESSEESESEVEVEEKKKKSKTKTKEEPQQKPMSIRLDLNIELEIFLKAKIKGDITITFLQ